MNNFVDGNYRHFKVSLLSTFVFSLLNISIVVDKAISQEYEPDIHDTLFIENKFPSATTCKSCHPLHYEEWSVSQHAYALLSPINNSMQAAVTKLTNGTNADFCMRCHTPVGMQMKEPVFMNNIDRHPVSREGVTCIVCHRRSKPYGKVSGRLPISEGDIFEAVYGPYGNEELNRVIHSGEFEIVTERGGEGRAIHTKAKELSQFSSPAFCGACHDVNHVFGFRLEEAFSEYKSSPAARKSISCQDCHMGIEPGLPSGYTQAPVAIIGGKPTKVRRHTNHMFVGPDSSIVHPGIFPHNPTAQKIATLRQWLAFNYKAGWGTDDFEDNLPDDYEFPERWEDVAERYEARDIINDNQKLLEKAAVQRKKLLQVGFQLGDIIIDKADQNGIKFRVEVKNGTDGHNVPTGFDAERVVFLQITVTDKNGKVVFQSGDLDPNGDLRDEHSLYVHNGELPKDKYLFNLQSKFLVRMLHGGEREQVLPVNYSPDPLPFIRPSTQSTLLLGRPNSVRKHRKTIRPLDSKWAKYKIKRAQLSESEGPYKANIKLIAGMVPVNLIHAIEIAGFDYDMSPRDVAEEVVKAHITVWERDIVLNPGRIEAQPNQSITQEMSKK